MGDPTPKLLLLIRSLGYGGTERQVVSLARGLRARGFPLRLVTFYPGGELGRQAGEAGVAVESLDKRGRWNVAGFLWRLQRLLARERPDIVYSFLAVPNIVAACVRPLFRGMRLVWGVRASNMDLARYDWLSANAYRVEASLARLPDLVISNSHAGQTTAISRGFPGRTLRVIPNGIDVDTFRPCPAQGLTLRSRWGIAADEPLIGAVARLDPMKGHPTLLRALALLLPRRQVRLACVGTGDRGYRSRLEDLARQLGVADRVVWADPEPDVPAVYNALDLFCLPSSYGEGFPNALGEAMACGVPPVATDVGDCRAIVGTAGVVVPPDDPDALAAALESMLIRDAGSARASMSQAAREQVARRFTERALVDSTADALAALA